MFIPSNLAHRIDLVEARLVLAIVEHVRATHPEIACFTRPVAGGWALWAGAGNPINKVIGIGFDEVPAAAAFGDVECALAEHGAEVRAEVSTLARAETHQWLCRRGYVLQGFENVLGCPLAAEAVGAPGVAGIDVALASAGELGDWVATIAAGFAAPDASGAGGDHWLPPAEALPAVFDAIWRAPGFARYLARIGGEIAGGASMRVDGEIAVLAGAATLPAFRRRGVQRALLGARLRAASDAGARLAVVTTQPGTISQANVQRQGFALLYARAVWVKAV